MLTEMTWLYFALLAPFLYAVVNLLDDNMLRHIYKGAHSAAIISGLFGIVPAIILLLLGKGGTLSLQLLVLALAAGFVSAWGFYFYFKGLEKEDPSVVAALYSLTPAAIPFIAYFLVDERLTVTMAVGCAILIASAFAYSMTDIRKFKFSKALLPVITSAIILDAAVLASSYIYAQADFYVSYIYYSVGIFLGGLALLILLKAKDKNFSVKKIYKKSSLKILMLLALVELVGLAAEFAQGRALSLGSVSIVSALGNIQPIFVLAIAILLFPFFPQFFREAESGKRLLKFSLLLAMVGGAYLAAS